jgi:hypothetical protein
MRMRAKSEPTPISYNCPNWQCCEDDPCPGCTTTRYFDFSSSQINSKDYYQYGYYELRCRFPNNSPSFIMRQVSQEFWFWSGWRKPDYSFDNYSEIDVFEHFPSDDQDPDSPLDANYRFATNVHGGDGIKHYDPVTGLETLSAFCKNALIYPFDFRPYMCIDLSENFHTYGLLFKRNSIEFFFDGIPLHDDTHFSSIYPIHLLTTVCDDRDFTVSMLQPMKVVLGNNIRNAHNPPGSGEVLKFDVDYFKFYKTKPDIIGPRSACENETVNYQAEMFGGTNTNDEYSWSITGNATIVTSTVGAEINVLVSSGSSFQLTLTATENTTGNYNSNTASFTNYISPRISTRTITVGTVKPYRPSPM